MADLITEDYFARQDPTLFIILLGVGGTILVLAGVTTTNYFGVEWEADREEEGMMLPFFYLTFLLREKPSLSKKDIIQEE